jgi:hypothetical protein
MHMYVHILIQGLRFYQFLLSLMNFLSHQSFVQSLNLSACSQLKELPTSIDKLIILLVFSYFVIALLKRISMHSSI